MPPAADREKPITLGIISHERIARSMAGPGIRCWELAQALCRDALVILLSPAESDLEPEGFEIVTYNGDNLAGRLKDCDAILCQGFVINDHPEIKELGASFIIDLYVPLTLEAMAQSAHLSIGKQRDIQGAILMSLMEQLAAGSFFICASDRQRDYWLGMLSAAGRIMPEVFKKDSTFEELIGLVPFGLPREPPVATKSVLKGVHEAIGAEDKVLLWGGGIYNWFDPFTPIRAMASLAERRSDVKLFFLSTSHPNPEVPKMRASDEAVALSRELGLFGKSVIFNDRWVDYEERVNFLMESDLGVYANIPHIETRFSFRTRVLDCLWSGLPVVATEGDAMSELVRERGLGLVVPSGDHAAFAEAVERLLDDSDFNARCRENLGALAPEFQWDVVAEPIRAFLKRLAAGEAMQPVIHQLGMANLGAELKDRERRIEQLQRGAGLAGPSLQTGKSILRKGRRAARGALRAGRIAGGGMRAAGRNIRAFRQRRSR